MNPVLKNLIIGSARIIPDKAYLSLMFLVKMKKFINWKNPRTFNEKLQWLKLYDRKPEYTRMVDKYEAKKYVAERIGEEYIIPTLGVWDRVEDIDFDQLPDQFVLKCTHDSGGLVICRDKSKFDIADAREKISRSLKRDYYLYGREWPYRNVKPRIIAEKYMEEDAFGCNECIPMEAKGLCDYKFFCFDGRPEFLYISQGLEDHATARISFLTMDWKFAPYRRSDYCSLEEIPPKPSQFDEMVEICKKLSVGHAFIRVDLYQVNNKVCFSELTFFPCSGFVPFMECEHDLALGCMINIPAKDRV